MLNIYTERMAKIMAYSSLCVVSLAVAFDINAAAKAALEKGSYKAFVSTLAKELIETFIA